MADSGNLCTASAYINNQLVSRGLVRDGEAIDFTQGSAEMAGRIMGVVNDLILRRDRDAQHRESLAGTMRALRSEYARQADEIACLTEQKADEQRRAELATASEAALRTQLKTAEAATRSQRDENARLRALVAQTRAACATEVRRRDRQLDTLKRQLVEAGRARGSKAGTGVTVISVAAGGVSHVGEETEALQGTGTKSGDGGSEYSLRDEMNAFLAQLAHDLSAENEAMLDLMQRAIGQLREMSGHSQSSDGEGRNDQDKRQAAAGTATAAAAAAETTAGAEVSRRHTYDELCEDLASVTAHMRTILTNPSFVPIEEVEAREEEIGRLRAGWVRMESRWEEAVRLIEGWRRRMAASGPPVCDEELKMGLRLSPVRVRGVMNDGDEDEDGGGDEAKDVREDQVLKSPCPSVNTKANTENDGDEMDLVAADTDSLPINGTTEPIIAVEQKQQSTSLFANRRSDIITPSTSQHPISLPLRTSVTAGNRGGTTSVAVKQEANKLMNREKREEKKTKQMEKDKGKERQRMTESSAARRSPRLSSNLIPTLTSKGEESEGVQPRSPLQSSLDEALLSRPPPALPPSSPPPTIDDNNDNVDTTASDGNGEDIKDGIDNEEPMSSHDSSQDELALPQPSYKLSPIKASRSTTATAATAAAAAGAQKLTRASSIAAKLAASARDAEAARVRAKVRAARDARSLGGGVSRPVFTQLQTHHRENQAHQTQDQQDQHQNSDQDQNQGQGDSAKKASPASQPPSTKPCKPQREENPGLNPAGPAGEKAPTPRPRRKREIKPQARLRAGGGKAASRRRSTLTPAELQALISG